MKTWTECLAEAGIPNMDAYLDERPREKYVWFAYRNGEAKKFSNKQDAVEFSSIIERIVENAEEISAFDDDHQKRHQHAAVIWMEALKQEYSDLPIRVFNIIDVYAYSAGHAYGYDAVAEKFFEYAEFATRIMEAANGK